MGLTVVALYLFTRDRWPLELTSLGLLALMAVGFASTAKKLSSGVLSHNLPSIRPTGSSAPVCTSPWPSTIRAHTAIKASWAKPANRCNGSND